MLYFAIFGFLGTLLINNIYIGLIIAIPVWIVAIVAWILFDEYQTSTLHKKSIIEKLINQDPFDN